jgi:2-polyprenyl-3-methyl-5-hydroxy-6-metoxy-1,4-benzoquinol methylase
MSSTGWSDSQIADELTSATVRPACPLCGNLAASRYKLAHTTVFQCESLPCHLQFAHPQLDDQALERAYASLYYPADDQHPAVLENATEFEVKRFLDAIKQYTGALKGKRILDYGCGNGVLLRVASELGADAVGIEQSATAREHIARSGSGRAYLNIDVLKQHERAARFDYITMCDAVEHLREPWVDLAKLRSLLLPGGRLFMTTPNSASLRSRIAGVRWDQRNNPTHFYYFDSRSLSNVSKRAGFADVLELPPITEYRHHGVARRLFQRTLARLGLHGGLLLMASH